MRLYPPNDVTLMKMYMAANMTPTAINAMNVKQKFQRLRLCSSVACTENAELLKTLPKRNLWHGQAHVADALDTGLGGPTPHSVAMHCAPPSWLLLEFAAGCCPAHALFHRAARLAA